MLVAARIGQGAGAALLVPQVLSLLQITFQGERRRRAMSAYGLVLAAVVAAGQVVGGILVSADLFGTAWRPIFLVNVPAGLAVLGCAAGRLPAGPAAAAGRLSGSPAAAVRLDLAGAGWLAADPARQLRRAGVHDRPVPAAHRARKPAAVRAHVRGIRGRVRHRLGHLDQASRYLAAPPPAGRVRGLRRRLRPARQRRSESPVASGGNVTDAEAGDGPHRS